MAGSRFGRRVRKLRKATRISLRKFADQMEMSAAYLSRIETGKFPPPAEDKILAMADALGADRDELLALAGKVSSEVQQALVDNSGWLPILVRRLAGLPERQRHLLEDGRAATIRVTGESVSVGKDAEPSPGTAGAGIAMHLVEEPPVDELQGLTVGQPDLFSVLEEED
ncbi:helix-turn-helix domain-containing protein [Candidatus Fermentibacterales bacterium]|nr:helix-turn-helix domain-containing protein [Candidatus Fermentibacterales bacterium]